MPGVTTTPPFPKNVATHPLLILDYSMLRLRDSDEIAKLWKAATELGFWYLKNHGVDEEANAMFEMGKQALFFPLEDKMKFEQGDSGYSFGYKAAGATVTDETGAPDTVEFLNVSKDDALAWPSVAHRTYPASVNAHMEDAVIPFVRKSMAINTMTLNILDDLLGLPQGTLADLHTLEGPSGSEARVIKSQPNTGSVNEVKASLASHTDFGSLTFLHNKLGGLQVMVPGTDQWQYVEPIPGHAICNIGDALSIFSGGLLKSNLHRVVPPPGPQARHTRYSVVFFTRPSDSVVLRALTNESSVIAEAAARAPENLRKLFASGQTSREWLFRRVRNMRTKNQKGTDVWRASRGTEHTPLAA